MTRYGQQFGPDFTFLGVPMCDLDDPLTYADAQVVILGAPFDGGTSARSGARLGPMAIRMRDDLPHDGDDPASPCAPTASRTSASWTPVTSRCIPATSRSPSRRWRLLSKAYLRANTNKVPL
jgi:hypothetical protein